MRELSGQMDIHVTHDLSRRISLRKSDHVRSYDSEIFATSKIEMMGNTAREVQ